MSALLQLVDTIIGIYIWLLIAWVIVSWLVSFNVLNTRNQLVHMIGDLLQRVTNPVLRPIRNLLPTMGGIDISPVVAVLALTFIRNLVVEYWPR